MARKGLMRLLVMGSTMGLVALMFYFTLAVAVKGSITLVEPVQVIIIAEVIIVGLTFAGLAWVARDLANRGYE